MELDGVAGYEEVGVDREHLCRLPGLLPPLLSVYPEDCRQEEVPQLGHNLSRQVGVGRDSSAVGEDLSEGRLIVVESLPVNGTEELRVVSSLVTNILVKPNVYRLISVLQS